MSLSRHNKITLLTAIMNNQTSSSVVKVEAVDVRFDGFEDLPTPKANDNFVNSPKFTVFGHQWFLCLFPCGSALSRDGQVAVYLHHESNESIKVQAILPSSSNHPPSSAFHHLTAIVIQGA